MRHGRGFTLIETAAAVVILALIVLPLLAARNATVASAVKASQRMILADLAASKLSEICSMPMENIERTGNFEDHPECTWEFTIEEESEEEDEEESTIEAPEGPILYRVTLVVSYPSADAEDSQKALTVSTLVLQAPDEQDRL